MINQKNTQKKDRMRTVSALITLFAIITPLVSGNLRGHRETQETDFNDFIAEALGKLFKLSLPDDIEGFLSRIEQNARLVSG